MAKIPETFDIGDREDLTIERLLELLETSYTDLAIAINKKPDIIERTSDGLTTDAFLSNGTININTSTLTVEILTEHPTSTTVTWQTI